MIEHPETDKTKLETIGLWWEKDSIVGAAIYDMYYGEAFCGVLKAYEFAWLLWQGFDHGNDKSEFKSQDKKEQQLRKHLDKRLSLTAVDSLGNIDSYVFFLLERINDKH